MHILISACLLGINCRYDGTSGILDDIQELMKEHTLIPICPEIYGGLPTPRIPSEKRENKVINQIGEDVTLEFQKGAEEALKLAKLYGCEKAILKGKSPSCGYGQIYDGTFTRTLVDGNGVLAQLLEDNGIEVIVQ